MKDTTKLFTGFGITIVLLLVIFFWIIKIYPVKQQTLILPEEICQASKGDHMQFYQRNDTIFLEYTFVRKGVKPPVIKGQQVTVGEDINYKQDDVINVDTIKKLYNDVSTIANSLKH